MGGQDYRRRMSNVKSQSREHHLPEISAASALQGWSLTAEECFYFSAPFILVFEKIEIADAFCHSFLGGWRIIIFRNVDFYGFFGNFNFLLFYLLRRCFEFFVGMKLALIFKNRQYNTGARHRTILGILWIIACLTAMVFVGLQFSLLAEYEQYSVTGSYLC